MDEDPFACFDEDSEEDHDEDNNDDTIAIPARDDECGVLTFHRGTEQSLINYVRNYLSGEAEETTPESVMNAVDNFCVQRHWMMHVGPEKRHQLEASLRECVSSRSSSGSPFVLLELGTYCGYSSVLWANALQKLGVDFHIYTVEASLEFAGVAKGLIDLAGLASPISVLHLDLLQNQKLVNLLSNSVSTVDLLFIDHDKEAYLEDLQELERARLVRAGTHVVADNILFARIDDYRSYIQELAAKGIVRSRLEKASLEYSEIERRSASDPTLYEDGIGKNVTVWSYLAQYADTLVHSLLIRCLIIFSSLQKSLSTLEIQIDFVDSPVSLLTTLAWDKSTAFFCRVKERCLTAATRWGKKLSEVSSLAYSLHYKLNRSYGRPPRNFYHTTPLRNSRAMVATK